MSGPTVDPTLPADPTPAPSQARTDSISTWAIYVLAGMCVVGLVILGLVPSAQASAVLPILENMLAVLIGGGVGTHLVTRANG